MHFIVCIFFVVANVVWGSNSNFAMVYYTEYESLYSTRRSFYNIFNMTSNTLQSTFYSNEDASYNIPRQFVLDPTEQFVYYIGGNQQQTIYKMFLNSPVVPHIDNPVLTGYKINPAGINHKDGNLSEAVFFRVGDISAPDDLSFIVVSDKIQERVRLINLTIKNVTTLFYDYAYNLKVSSNGLFFVYANSYNLYAFFFHNSSVVPLTGGGQGYQDGVGVAIKSQVSTSLAISRDNSYVYFTHYSVNMYTDVIRRVHLYTKKSETLFTSNVYYACYMMAFDKSSQYLFANFKSTYSMVVFRVDGSTLVVVQEFANPSSSFGVQYVGMNMQILGTYNPPPTTTGAPTTSAVTTTAAPATSSGVGMTSTTGAITTTAAPVVKINFGVGESCLDYFSGFEDNIIFAHCCENFTNSYGCNDNDIKLFAYDQNLRADACPWSLNHGCNIVQTESSVCIPMSQGGGNDCKRVCEPGCRSKVACTNLPLNAHYTGSGTNSTNCPWVCNDYYKFNGSFCVACTLPLNAYFTGTGGSTADCPWLCHDNYEWTGAACVLKVNYTVPAPNATTQFRCTRHDQCSHCPRVSYYGQPSQNAWGCSNYEIRVHDLNTNTSFNQLLGLFTHLWTGYCTYWVNPTTPAYCVDSVYLPQYTYDRRCSVAQDCEYCPMDRYYTSNSITRAYGCYGYFKQIRWVDSQVNLVETPINFLPYLQREFLNGTCIYFENTVPYHCPDPVTSSAAVLSSTSGAVVSGTTSVRVLIVPDVNCAAYSDCSHCPTGVTRGCNGVSVVQYVNGEPDVILTNYNLSGMAYRRCVYASALSQYEYCLPPTTTTQAVSTTTTAGGPQPIFCWSQADCEKCPPESTVYCNVNQCYFRSTYSYLLCDASKTYSTTTLQITTTSSKITTTTELTTSTPVLTTTAKQWQFFFWVRSNSGWITGYYSAQYMRAIYETLQLRVDQVQLGTLVDKFRLPVVINFDTLESRNDTIKTLKDSLYSDALMIKLLQFKVYMNHYNYMNMQPPDRLYIDFTDDVEPVDLTGTSRIPCSNWNPCNACPYGYSRGCSGKDMVIQNPWNRQWFFILNFIAPETSRNFCVFHNDAQWMYCPVDPAAAARLTWQLIFSILVQKPTLTADEIDLYRLATAMVLGINSTQITAAMYPTNTNLFLMRRRLLQSSTELGMIVDLNSVQNLAEMSSFVRTSAFQTGLDAAIVQLTLTPASMNVSTVDSYTPAMDAAVRETVTENKGVEFKSEESNKGDSDMLLIAACLGALGALLIIVGVVLCTRKNNKKLDAPFIFPQIPRRNRRLKYEKLLK